MLLLGDATVVYGGYEGAELQTAEHNGRATSDSKAEVDNGGRLQGDGRGKGSSLFRAWPGKPEVHIRCASSM